jgi:glycosyltransferase involved in cell wall biosynthesis
MGGAENQVIALADRFAEQGHQVLLIALTGVPVLKPSHPKVMLVMLGMARTPVSFLRSYICARRILAKFAPDVVHSHMVHANLFCRLLRLTVQMRRLICSAHNSNEGGSARMLAYRLTDRLADITTNVSDEAVQSFLLRKAVSHGRIVTMHNGIDAERFKYSNADRVRLRSEMGITSDSQVLLSVGRLCEQKDYLNLIHAFAYLCKVHNECVLWIVGTGDAPDLYEDEARRLGVGDKVRFLGLRRDVPALMSTADIFVLSSAWEGLPLVIGEAMACERVVVSTDAGGVREWLGEAGYVVPTRNSEALGAALCNAVRLSETERQRLGKAGRKRIMDQYALSAVIAGWLRFYREEFEFRPQGSLRNSAAIFRSLWRSK